MKKILTNLKGILILAIAFAFFSCKKGNTSDTKQCRITKAIFTSGNSSVIYNMSYNSNGTVSVIIASVGTDSNIKTFSYEANKIIVISKTYPGNDESKQEVTLNNDNKFINIRSWYNASGTQWANTQIVYDNNGNLLKEIFTSSSNNSSATKNYTVSNGDIIKESYQNSTTAYDFYLDKPYQKGDYFGFQSLIRYGMEGYRKNAHLVKSALASGNTIPTQINYEFNSEGMISRILFSSPGNTDNISYSYECN